MNSLKNEQGSALAYVLISMVVVFILVGGLITVAQSENYQAIYQNKYLKAYYISRAGAESMVLYMKEIDKSYYSEFDLSPNANAQHVLDTEGDLQVNVTTDPNDSTKYIIESQGTYRNVKAKTTIHMKYAQGFDVMYSAYSRAQMDRVDGDGSSNNPNNIAPYEINVRTIQGPLGSNDEVITSDDSLVTFQTNWQPDFYYPMFNLNGTYIPHDPNNSNTSEVYDIYPFDSAYHFNIIDTENDVYYVLDNEGDETDEIAINKSTTFLIGNPNNTFVNNVIINIDTESAADTFKYYKNDPLYNNDGEAISGEYGAPTSTTDFMDNKYTLLNDGVGGNEEEWMIVYFHGDALINGTINVSGNKNLIIVTDGKLDFEGDFNINGDALVEVYIMDTSNDGDMDLILDTAGGNIGKAYDTSSPITDDAGSNPNTSRQLIFYMYGERSSTDYENILISNEGYIGNGSTNNDIFAYFFGTEATWDLNNGRTTIYGSVLGHEVNLASNTSVVLPEYDFTEFFDYYEMQIDYWE